MTDFPVMTGSTSLQEALKALMAAGVAHAHVGLFDLMGTFRERRLGVEEMGRVMDGGGTFVNVLPFWNAGEQLFGGGPFVGEAVSVDPASIRPYPFEPNACLAVADYRGPSSNFSPRQLLQRQIEKAQAMGFSVQAAIESEFFVLRETCDSLRDNGFATVRPFAPDNRCWAGESAATHAAFVSELNDLLTRGGMDLLSLSLELGPGCFEATHKATDPLRAAEDHLFFKMMTKAFCRQRGLTASFMAQLDSQLPGLSQHPHLSLLDKESGLNLFSADGDRMGGIFENFAAGVLALIPEAMALTHPTTNSYRRIAPGNWAPKSATWARQNYSAALRVVLFPEEFCRLEYRLPGADANPYLNLAFVLGAGLWGIESGAKLPEEFQGGSPDDVPAAATPLPHDLFEAAHRLTGSERSKEIWGVPFIEHFVAALRSEDAALRREVSAAERARYLEVV